METTSSYLQAEEEPFDDELLQQQYEIKSAEESFRTLISRIATAAVFLVSCLIVFYLLPFYPKPMAIFLALVPAVIAFRWPAIALFLMLLFAAPAYSYQLGVTIWALGIMISVAIVLPFGLSKLPGASIGSAVGAASAVLMLTPYYYLAIPLLAGTTLFRFRGSTAGGAWGLFVFLLFYLPFISLVDTSAVNGETLPLFIQADYSQQPALSNLDMNSLKTAFEGQINNSFSGFDGFPAYFVEGWGGVALVLTMFAAIVITPAIVNTTRRLKENGSILIGTIPLVLLLLVELVFLVPLLLLAEPLGYHTGLAEGNNIAILTGIMLGLGITAFAVETWLRRRNLKVWFRSELAILSLELYNLLDSAKAYLQQVASVCRNCDLSHEKGVISQYEEKVALTLESMGVLGLTRLEYSFNDFSDMQTQLPVLQEQLENKLYANLDESRHAYKTVVEQATNLGIPDVKEISQIVQAPTADHEYDQSLREQEQLNESFRELASKLVSTGDTVAQTINDEIDPEFSLTTIDISHGFLDQGRYEEAARTITEDLQIIDGRIESSIIELANRVIAMGNSFREVLSSRLTPVLESIGDAESLDVCKSTATELGQISAAMQNSRTLADVISIVEQSRKLAELATIIVKELDQKIKYIEEDNDRRCPAKYSWGKNSHATSEIKQLLDSIKKRSSEPSISNRFIVIEKAIQAMDQQARTIKQYSQASEFLINYPNIEYIVQEKLTDKVTVGSSEIPVKSKYAQEYLKMYAAMNNKTVTFDSKSGVIRHVGSNGSSQEEIAL